MSAANKNTYALVTGGSSGIGLAFVHQLAKKGYNICVVSNDKDRLAAVEQEISEKYSVQCRSIYIDLTEDTAAHKIHDFCLEQKLTIEVLINNAGFLIAEQFVQVPEEKAMAILKLHTLTPTLLCQVMAKDMIARGKGYILNVSSTSAYMPYPLISLYGPTKSYLLNFSRAIRHELYSKNVHVSCILPGAVNTELYSLSSSNRKLGARLGIIHSPEFIAKRGLRIMFKNRAKSVPGILNKLSLVFLKLVPGFALRKLYNKQANSMKDKD